MIRARLGVRYSLVLSVGISRHMVAYGMALGWLGACTGASNAARAPAPAGQPVKVAVTPVAEADPGPEHAHASAWTLWPLPPQPFSPLRLLAAPGRSVTVFSVADEGVNLTGEAEAIERTAREPRAALERFELGAAPQLVSAWRYPMRVGAMSAPVVGSGPEGSVIVAGDWVTGTREFTESGLPGLEVLSDGYLQHIAAGGSVARQRKLPPLSAKGVLQNGDTGFILEQESDPNTSDLAFHVSVRVVGSAGQSELRVPLVSAGPQVAGPMVALPHGGIVVAAPFGVLEGFEAFSRFIWLSQDGAPRFTREVAGATRNFGANDGLAMLATANGSIAVAFRCLGETRLLQVGAPPITLAGTAFSEETHDLCLWHYDGQGRPHGAQRIRRLGYLSVETLVERPDGELLLLGHADDRPRLWRFDAAWSARGEVPVPEEVDWIADLVLLSNGDVVALVALKKPGIDADHTAPRFALAQVLTADG